MLQMVAVRGVKRGEEVFNTYGPAGDGGATSTYS